MYNHFKYIVAFVVIGCFAQCNSRLIPVDDHNGGYPGDSVKGLTAQTNGFRTEIEALRFLFTDPWRKYEAPFDNNGTATVKHMLMLNRIVSLDLKKQVLTIDAWIYEQYLDGDLAWRPSMFGELTTIHVPDHLIWHPDILLYNSAAKSNGHTEEVMSILTYDGTVLRIQPVQLQSYCHTPKSMSAGYNVTCTLKFGSWTYDGFKLDLQLMNDKVDLSDYDAAINRDWKLLSTSATRNVKTYPCCAEPYIDIEYKIELTPKFE